MKEYYSQLQEMLEQANEAGEAAGEGYKVLGKCIKIAMRIVSGDIVPIQDEKFLMENNEKLYSMAMNMRMIKEEPEEWDSILDEDKDAPKLADGSVEKVMEIPEVVQVEE